MTKSLAEEPTDAGIFFEVDAVRNHRSTKLCSCKDGSTGWPPHIISTCADYKTVSIYSTRNAPANNLNYYFWFGKKMCCQNRKVHIDPWDLRKRVALEMTKFQTNIWEIQVLFSPGKTWTQGERTKSHYFSTFNVISAPSAYLVTC